MADVEHKIASFPISPQLAEQLEVLAAEGWNLVPGVAPIAVYHLVRERKPAPQHGARGVLTVDDSKIMIIPGSEKKQ